MSDLQQRRLTTILAADVFGFSRLMAEDEENTLRTLKAHRSIIDRLISRHEGRIFNTAGDSVLAEFGSAVEAVRSAIAIQEELRFRNTQLDQNRRMELRIGINVGDVLVDGENLYGDGVNIAARLESIALPGNICVSASVFSLVKNKLSYGFEDIGPQSVKNIPEPISAFRLLQSETVKTVKASNLDWRWIAAGISLFVLIAAAGAWILSGASMPTSTPSKTASQARPSQARTEPMPRSAGRAFDGKWEFQLTGGQYCPIKSLTFRRTILHGAVMAEDGTKLGAVDKDGRFEFSNPSPTNRSITVKSQGTLTGLTGQGLYEGVGTPCQGTYQIRLIENTRG